MAGAAPSPAEERQFFIQSVDGPSGFALSEVDCGLSTIEIVSQAIDADIADFDVLNVHRLDRGQIRAAKKLFDVEFEPGDSEVYLRIVESWRRIALSSASQPGLDPDAVRGEAIIRFVRHDSRQ